MMNGKDLDCRDRARRKSLRLVDARVGRVECAEMQHDYHWSLPLVPECAHWDPEETHTHHASKIQHSHEKVKAKVAA